VELQKKLQTPICLDECIHALEHAQAAIALGACKIINIKMGRVGGYTVAKQIHDLCQANAIPVWCGGMLESGIGRAHNIALSSLPNFILPGDVSASRRYWHEDIIEPEVTVSAQGTIRVPTGPGIGFAPRLDRIEKFTVRQERLACVGVRRDFRRAGSQSRRDGCIDRTRRGGLGLQLHCRENRVALPSSADHGIVSRDDRRAIYGSSLPGLLTMAGICRCAECALSGTYAARSLDIRLLGIFRRGGQPNVLHDGLALHVGEPCGRHCGDGADLYISAGGAVSLRAGDLAQSGRHGHCVSGRRGAGFREWDLGAIIAVAARRCNYDDGFDRLRYLCGAGEARCRTI
jgi:hypothetical protein